MIRATHQTIRDYWGYNDQRMKPADCNDAEKNAFRQIMQSVYPSDDHAGRSRYQGLTIQDYRRQPVATIPQALPGSGPKAQTKAPLVGNTPPLQASDKKPESPDFSRMDAASALRKQIDRAVKDAARKYGLPVGLVHSVIRHESGFNPQAESTAGAQGLMQLMPATAKELGVVDPFDIRQNIDAGSRYLKQMLDRFDGDLRKALAAYNAGPGTVRKYGGIPPYPETRNYVHKVMKSAAELA